MLYFPARWPSRFFFCDIWCVRKQNKAVPNSSVLLFCKISITLIFVSMLTTNTIIQVTSTGHLNMKYEWSMTYIRLATIYDCSSWQYSERKTNHKKISRYYGNVQTMGCAARTKRAAHPIFWDCPNCVELFIYTTLYDFSKYMNGI